MITPDQNLCDQLGCTLNDQLPSPDIPVHLLPSVFWQPLLPSLWSFLLIAVLQHKFSFRIIIWTSHCFELILRPFIHIVHFFSWVVIWFHMHIFRFQCIRSSVYLLSHSIVPPPCCICSPLQLIVIPAPYVAEPHSSGQQSHPFSHPHWIIHRFDLKAHYPLHPLAPWAVRPMAVWTLLPIVPIIWPRFLSLWTISIIPRFSSCLLSAPFVCIFGNFINVECSCLIWLVANSRYLMHSAIPFSVLARLHVHIVACHPKFKVVHLEAWIMGF